MCFISSYVTDEIQMDGFKTLKEGQKIKFEVTQGPKGKQASSIQSAT